jgi:hypothetical protein
VYLFLILFHANVVVCVCAASAAAKKLVLTQEEFVKLTSAGALRFKPPATPTTPTPLAPGVTMTTTVSSPSPLVNPTAACFDDMVSSVCQLGVVVNIGLRVWE